MSTDLQPPPTPEPPLKHRRRVFPWVFLAVQVFFLVWVIAGGHNAAGTNCNGLSANSCDTARQVGTTIGVGLIIAFWAAVDIILGITYLLFRITRKGR